MRTKCSIRYLLAASMIVLTFSGIDCRRNPVGPPPGADTTSNNFTFQIFTFGAANAGSSYLQDVAVINDTDIWAVGAIYLDSADGAPDPFPYNAVHWDGKQWHPMKLTVQTKYGLVTAPFYGVDAFSTNDIWISSGLPIHGDGKSWTQYDLYSMGILGQNDGYLTKIWGSNSSNVYFAGTTGSIVHYASGSWTKITTGTDLSFDDIYGSGGQILAVCSRNYPFGEGIFNIQGNTATQISSSLVEQHELFGVWFIPDRQYYIVGDGIYQKNSLSDSTWRNGPLDFTRYTSSEIRGNDTNDVFVVGAYGEFLHWNAIRWKSFINETGLSNGSYTSVAVRENLIIAAGYNSNEAVITVARRN